MTTLRTTVHDPLALEVVADGLGFPEGPCIRDDGSVLAVDIEHGTIVLVAGGETTVVASPGGGPNGMALAGDGSAYVANNGGFLWTDVGGFRIPIDRETHTNEPPGFVNGWIERIDLGTGDVTVLHDSCGGRHLRGPNDLVFDDVGGLWFTDHGKGRHASVDRGGLYYLPPGAGEVQEIAFPLLGANGVGLSPDGRRVYVAETFTGRLWAWDLDGPGRVRRDAGSLAVRHGGVCVAATPFAFDSLAVEEGGRIAIGAIGDGVVVITPDGTEIDVHPIPGDITTNIAFGGADRRRAVISLSRSGQLVETTWPRPGLALNRP
jgi:gluconolactonase